MAVRMTTPSPKKRFLGQWIALSLILFVLYEILWFPVDRYYHEEGYAFLHGAEWSVDLMICMILAWVDIKIVHFYVVRRFFLTWRKNQIRWLTIGLMGLNLLIAVGCTILENFCYGRLGILDWDRTDNVLNTYGLALISTAWVTVSLLIYCIVQYQEIARQREREWRAASETRMLALQSQINPHFLFNNLSVAIGLIETDPTKATQFLSDMAAFYRHTLQRTPQLHIPLKEELQHLRRFMSLMEIRHGHAVEVRWEEALNDSSARIFPGTLQLLLENVFKHNRLSVADPIQVSIRIEGERFVVENDYRPITPLVESCGIGQDNIQQRYEAIGSERVRFEVKDQKYIVQFPVLSNERV